MTRDELERIVASGELTVGFVTALAAHNIGETAGRTALKRGTPLPFRVVRVGNCLRVPVVDLEEQLLRPRLADTAHPVRAHA